MDKQINEKSTNIRFDVLENDDNNFFEGTLSIKITNTIAQIKINQLLAIILGIKTFRDYEDRKLFFDIDINQTKLCQIDLLYPLREIKLFTDLFQPRHYAEVGYKAFSQNELVPFLTNNKEIKYLNLPSFRQKIEIFNHNNSTLYFMDMFGGKIKFNFAEVFFYVTC